MSARKITIEFVKTYASEANAIKAVEKVYGEHEKDLRYMVVPTIDGRFGVLFLGEEALNNMVHFHFNVAF